MLINQVKIKIIKKLKKYRQNLQIFGTSRQISAQQSQYLIEIVMQFQKLFDKALLFNYECIDVFDQYSIFRFAIVVINRNKQMINIIAMKKHIFHFEIENENESNIFDDVDFLIVNISIFCTKNENAKNVIDIRTIENHSEFENLIEFAQKMFESRNEKFRV